MSHGPPLCSPSTFLNGFDEGAIGSQSRRVSCESGSQCNFAPQVGEISSKMECMAGKRCRFSLCQTHDFVFSREIDETRACKITLTPEEGHLPSSLSNCYYFESPSGRQVIRFDTDLECQQAPDLSPRCNFRCCMFSSAECANHWLSAGKLMNPSFGADTRG